MMKTKTVSQLDAQGYFVCATVADESPLEPGVYLFPSNCVDAEEPNIPEGKRAKWIGSWVIEDIPPLAPEPEPEPEPELTYQDLRAMAYPPMADYLDGIVKNDQSQIDAYIAACLAIKAKYPKP